MPSFELLLPMGAIGLYLYDSLLLLYANESLFVRHRRGWSVVAGSDLFVSGRRLCLPNPLTPHLPQFRVQWSERDGRQGLESASEVERFLAALRPAQYLVLVLLVLLLALPVELLCFGTGVALLVLFAAFYVVILSALVCVYVRRRDLTLTDRAFAALAVDVLACAPFGLNLVRKVSVRRSLAGNPLVFAQHAFDAEAFANLVDLVCQRVVEEQRREDDQSPRWLELEAFRQRLLGRTGPP
jgi:hypothetical protein